MTARPRAFAGVLFSILVGCTAAKVTPEPDTAAAPADDTGTDTAAASTCTGMAPSEARLELESYAYAGFDEARRMPGYLRSAIFRNDEDLGVWLEVMQSSVPLEWTIDWEHEVALLGYLDTLVGRTTEFALINLEGVGTDELTSRWCVVWPKTLADQDSRSLAVYAIPTGAYTTLHENLRWDNQEDFE